ncbi:hypothetical protein ABZY06_33755 [Streptomyces sp. NPDC006540]|uniref:hypothetical protein n=1 Tax=Streptomyces sp. NPDC006540 TaxID=3155353 RepID=UPI0033B3F914
MITISWAVEGHGVGAKRVRTTDEASAALTAGVRAALEGQPPEAIAQFLHGALGTVRHLLLTDGVTALQNAGRWSYAVSGLAVTMARE